MNDQTPRQYRGSLLERASERQGFAYPPVDALREFAKPEPVFTPEVEREVAPNPIAASPMHAEPVAAARPAPDPVPAPAAVPQRPAQRRAPRPVRAPVAIDRDRLAERGMIVPGAPVGVLAEEFRLVKRQLLQTARLVSQSDDDAARMILVCSARPGDGKTFCAVNLAMSLAAEREVQVLLVDADFAKPDVHAMLGVEAGQGLLDALADPSIDVESLIVPTDVPQLSLLPAGPRTNSDTELLASDHARRVLRSLAANDTSRIVIFDSPPALAASPASVLAGLVGQVALVVRADSTSESDLREAVALLDGCDHVQLLLNAVSYTPGGARFGTYYGDSQ